LSIHKKIRIRNESIYGIRRDKVGVFTELLVITRHITDHSPELVTALFFRIHVQHLGTSTYFGDSFSR
jgi:hypothetical protein